MPRLLFFQATSLFERYGGIEYYLDDLIQCASNLYGQENVCTLVPHRGTFQHQDRGYPYRPVFYPKNRIGQKITNRLLLPYSQQAKQEIEKFRPTHLVCGHISLGPMVRHLAKKFGLPYFSCVYGIESWGKGFPQDEWGLKGSTKIFSISEWTKSQLVHRGYSPSHIDIVVPVLESSFENAPTNKIAEEGPLRLLSVSRLDSQERYKGQDDVIRALAQLKTQVSFQIVGDGDDKERLKQLARDLNVDVTFTSALKKRDELWNVFRDSDVYIMPSKFGGRGRKWQGEGFGIVYVEAAAFGIPSIAYDCGGATDIIRNNETGLLVKQNDIEGLAQAIEKLAGDRTLCQKMGEAAKERALSHFTKSQMTSQFAAALDQPQPSKNRLTA